MNNIDKVAKGTDAVKIGIAVVGHLCDQIRNAMEGIKIPDAVSTTSKKEQEIEMTTILPDVSGDPLLIEEDWVEVQADCLEPSSEHEESVMSWSDRLKHESSVLFRFLSKPTGLK